MCDEGRAAVVDGLAADDGPAAVYSVLVPTPLLGLLPPPAAAAPKPKREGIGAAAEDVRAPVPLLLGRDEDAEPSRCRPAAVGGTPLVRRPSIVGRCGAHWTRSRA